MIFNHLITSVGGRTFAENSTTTIMDLFSRRCRNFGISVVF
jgi:hypothetical protein